MIIAAILSLLLIITSVLGLRSFNDEREATEKYILCEKAAQKLQKGSDVLTEQVRLFVLTGDARYMDGYFTEANVTKSRDTALEELSVYFADSSVFAALQEALGESRTLMEREFYAMRLVVDALDMKKDSVPQEVLSVELSEKDRGRTPEEKLEAARGYVSDSVYQMYKTRISDGVTRCMDGIIEYTENQQKWDATLFRIFYVVQEIGLAALIVAFVVSNFIVRKMIVQPLIEYNDSIRRNTTVPVVGAVELQSLAETYNSVFEANAEAQRMIRREAEHDALTDLLNKGAFDKALNRYSQGSAPYALIIADIDTFKSINDTFGHAAGDEALRAFANSLKKAFGSSDCVARVGGDEFSVIVAGSAEKLRSVVSEKLYEVQKDLASYSEDHPRMTVSFGVSFSDGIRPRDKMFIDADKALYYVKKHGKGGIKFAE